MEGRLEEDESQSSELYRRNTSMHIKGKYPQ